MSLVVKLVLVGVAVGGFALLGVVLPPETFSMVVSGATIVMMGVSILMVLVKFRKERPFKKLPQILAVITPLAALALHLAVFASGGKGGKTVFMLLFPAVLVGLVVGGLWSRATKLARKGDQVVGRNAGWWLVFWALSFMITQGMVLTRKADAVQVSLVLLALTSGIAAGTAGGLLFSIGAALRRAVAPPPPMPAPAPVPPAPPGGFCEQCGAPATPDSRFCEGCGAAL